MLQLIFRMFLLVQASSVVTDRDVHITGDCSKRELAAMKAMVLNRIWRLEENRKPLELIDLPEPVPKERPVVLGQQIVGRMEKRGSEAGELEVREFFDEYEVGRWAKKSHNQLT